MLSGIVGLGKYFYKEYATVATWLRAGGNGRH